MHVEGDENSNDSLSVNDNNDALNAEENDGNNVSVHIKIGNQSLPVLSIPKSVIPFYTLKPYKLLKFLGFIIYGSSEPGFITVSQDGDELPDEQMDSDELMHDDVHYVPSGMLQVSLNII